MIDSYASRFILGNIAQIFFEDLHFCNRSYRSIDDVNILFGIYLQKLNPTDNNSDQID
jgi:hypothetical protein